MDTTDQTRTSIDIATDACSTCRIGRGRAGNAHAVLSHPLPVGTVSSARYAGAVDIGVGAGAAARGRFFLPWGHTPALRVGANPAIRITRYRSTETKSRPVIALARRRAADDTHQTNITWSIIGEHVRRISAGHTGRRIVSIAVRVERAGVAILTGGAGRGAGAPNTTPALAFITNSA